VRVDEKRHHEEAITRHQKQYNRLQSRIDKMYVDKLDSNITAEFFEQKAAEWRAEQEQALRAIETHQQANQTYLEQGIRLLELARRARFLFEKQSAGEKRRLLNFLLSHCSWRDGQLTAQFRQPFDILAVAAESHQSKKAAGATSDDLFANWRADGGANHHLGRLRLCL
jgi:site-specific DNA recombinase